MNHTDRLTAALADRYRILEHLGEGGMATVYLAEDLKHQRNVMVKEQGPEIAVLDGQNNPNANSHRLELDRRGVGERRN